MRPYVDRCQKLPNGVDGYLPKSASDIGITAMVMKYMQRWPFRPIAERKVVHHRRGRRPARLPLIAAQHHYPTGALVGHVDVARLDCHVVGLVQTAEWQLGRGIEVRREFQHSVVTGVDYIEVVVTVQRDSLRMQ